MNLSFYMPTKVLMGKNIVKNNGKVLCNYGKKALIVTGKYSSKVNGSLNDTTEALNENEIDYVIFDEVEENPSLETIEAAANIGKDSMVDFVIGIGGGSPLDAAKAIAVMIKNPELNKDNILTDRKLESIEVIAIPTTAGTGSETTQYSIVTVHKEKTKKNLGQSIFPAIAFLDASYMEGMNVKTTTSTAVDALSHLVEGYLNVNANLITDTLVEKGLSLWGQCIEDLLKEEYSFETRENLMLASTLAGMVIAQTGTSLPHGMGYSLTYFKNVPHGIANVCLYKEYLNVFKNRERVNNIWKVLNLSSYDEMINILCKLSEVNIDVTEEELKEYTDGMWNNKMKLKNHPEEIQYEELYNIYLRTLKK